MGSAAQDVMGRPIKPPSSSKSHVTGWSADVATNESPDSSSSSTPIAAIVGSPVCGVVSEDWLVSVSHRELMRAVPSADARIASVASWPSPRALVELEPAIRNWMEASERSGRTSMESAGSSRMQDCAE